MGELININYNNKEVTSLWDYNNDSSLIIVDVDIKQKQQNEVD
jgi:hypothetical protein